jgi:hypothetical protein
MSMLLPWGLIIPRRRGVGCALLIGEVSVRSERSDQQDRMKYCRSGVVALHTSTGVEESS